MKTVERLQVRAEPVAMETWSALQRVEMWPSKVLTSECGLKWSRYNYIKRVWYNCNSDCFVEEIVNNAKNSVTKCLTLRLFLFSHSTHTHTALHILTSKHQTQTHALPSNLSLCPPVDAAAGPGGAVGLPLSCCHGGGCSDAAARRPQSQQHHCHANRIHHPLLR